LTIIWKIAAVCCSIHLMGPDFLFLIRFLFDRGSESEHLWFNTFKRGKTDSRWVPLKSCWFASLNFFCPKLIGVQMVIHNYYFYILSN
jgi:hypothetical protein